MIRNGLIKVLMVILVGIFIIFLPQKIYQPPQWEKVADGLEFPEGPAWNGWGTLFVSDCYGKWIAQVNNNTIDTLLTFGKNTGQSNNPNGLCYFRGALYICDFGQGQILKYTDKNLIQPVVSGIHGRRFNRPNDLIISDDSTLYFTDPNSYDCQHPDGFVYRVNLRNGRVEPLISGIAFPNGLALSNDGKYLFISESACQQILKFELSGDSVGNEEIFITLPGGDPDGIEFDRAGNLYVAHFGGGFVYKINPQGTIVQRWATPGRKPTNLEFGDRDRRTLFLTEVETGAIYRMRLKSRGNKRGI